MNGKNKLIISYGLWFFDMISILLSFLLATYLRFGNFKDMRDKNSHFMVCLVFVLLGTLYYFVFPLADRFMKDKAVSEFLKCVKMNVIVVLMTQPVMYFLKWADGFSRKVTVFFIIINIVLTFLIHMLFKKLMKLYFKSDLVRIKVLVLTEEALKEDVIEKLKGNLDLSYQLLSVWCVSELPEDYHDRLTQMALDEVFIYAPSWSQSRVSEEVAFFDEMGVVCHCCVSFPDMVDRKSSVGDFAAYPVITYSHINISYIKLLLKRVIDIIGGIVGCLILLIMLPFVAIAIKADSKGPVFFSQTRIGRNGRRFKIWKFRSMYTDAEERKKELQDRNEVSGLMFKMKDDPRITKVGKFLRKTSIDEFPQFINILKGDMSLVGTRPPTEDEFEKYNTHYRRRISMTPGLTGLWQVSGRSDIDDFDEVVKLDLKYIDEWSLGLDISILFKTIWVVFSGRGSK